MAILIVDDEPVNTLVLEQLLHQHDYETVSVSSGEEALDLLMAPQAASLYDLVLLDVEMPGISGIETCKRIRQMADFEELPVIMVSGRTEEKQIAEGLDAEASDYTTKPIKITELLARIRSALRYKAAVDERKIYEARLQYDLDLAQKIQQSALTPPISNEEIDVRALYLPSKKLAGDMYAWFQVAPDRYGVIIFDVMGHGVSSALITMGIRSILPGLVGNVQYPVDVMTELNRQMTFLFSGDDMHSYFTAVYCYIDTTKRRIEYVNAGHPPVIVTSEEGNCRLETTGVPVGMFEEPNYESKEIDITPNMMLHMYTDGLMECYSKDIDDGIRWLEKDVVTYGLDYSRHVAEQLVPKIEIEDDLCLVTVKIT
ncbi:MULTISPECIES: PP2C family protein-serine/threonine phosphatase [Exiguobacterium]|uniref:Response regulator receiver modulated serine phosphatase n=1 Tax=Exiguobacterium sp. (strain ATCC BAA-1283 / AT1b) TaxID=360911 RepID=C4L3A8_EXISA|nr:MULTISPECIES: SpoIIE family protein phosphatase [Exiguobacterium]ACQ69406.1 response regulator receiver modulated serine phosphatase [Exiguobacterium sp. AT1b]MCM3278909.1 SpoIIE family protein phosphatase [Exiguobacterium sp. MER 193]MDX5979840.1 SpoIIE family protein phosphatase [Exiguobacterium profundum]QUP88338.1 SpoIIE family protein phosphatase [Exiguobacterium sp. PFWT01]